MKPVAYILEPPRFGSTLVSSGAARVAPGFRMTDTPDQLQPYPYYHGYQFVDSYANEIAERIAGFDSGRIVNLVCLLRSCSDSRWLEHPPTEESILRGLITSTWECQWDIDMLAPLVRALNKRNVTIDLAYSDFEIAAQTNDPLYTRLVELWCQAMRQPASAFDAWVRQVADNTTRAIFGSVGWSQVQLIQPNQSLHSANPETGKYTTLDASDDVPTFRAKVQAAHDKQCLGVLIFTPAEVTDAELAAHGPALSELCEGGNQS